MKSFVGTRAHGRLLVPHSRSFGSALEPPVKAIHLSLSCQASTLLHCLTSEAPSCVRFCCGPSPRIFPESVCMATKERHHYSGLACTELIGTALLLAVLLVICWHFIGVVATASLFSALELALSSSSSSSSCHQFDSQLTGLGPVNNV